MTDLTDDEFSILLIASKGESMMPIGRWEKPVEDLVAKGFLKQHDRNNNTLTQAGKDAIAARDMADDKALAMVVSKGTAVALAREDIRVVAEGLAQTLAATARQSSTVTGDDLATAARKWSEIILTRALELLGERK